MGLHTALLSMAGAAVIANLAVVTSPTIAASVTVPRLGTDSFMITGQSGSTSVQFHAAKTSDVLAWLESHGFNFVVNDEDISRNKTVTLNVKNQSVESIANAVANALGGHWEMSNGIHVYKRGANTAGWDVKGSVPVIGSWKTDDVSGEWTKQFGPDFAKKFEGMDKMTPEQQKRLQKQIQDQFGPDFQMKIQKQMQDQFGPDFQKKIQSQFGPDFEKKMKDQFGPDFQKNFQGMGKMDAEQQKKLQKQLQNQFGPDFQKKMQDQFGPQFQKQMQDEFGPKFQKQMQDQFGPDFQKKMQGQNFGKMTPEQQKQFEKQMEEFGKKMELFGKQMEDQFGPKFEKQMEEMSKRMDKGFAKDEKNDSVRNKFYYRSDSTGSKDKTHVRVNGSNVDGSVLLKSLTPAQKDQQAKQGYIWFNDMTPEQRAMFGGIKGKFDFKVSINGQEVRVRRDY